GLPGGNSLFFCVAKRKVSKRKGDPMVWVPSLRYGQPAVLAENGAELELAALRQSFALIRFRLRSSAQPDGWGEKTNTPYKHQAPLRSAGSAQRFLHGNPNERSSLHASAAHAAK
ncbi:hypothetical protein, partial [Polaromonas sp.]|uniref:hypothetical protein n=1 Tax=Polaromonas sp. TaxID=1869339 RepID=UPI003751C715